MGDVVEDERVRLFYVYIIECADRSYYVGVTANYEHRLQQHHEGVFQTCYTFRRRPLTLVHLEEFSSIVDAITREKQLKRWSRAKKRALAQGDEQLLGKLARTQSGTVTVRHGSAGSP